jgi:hypothetical protein
MSRVRFLLAWWRRPTLDGQLGAGVDPGASAALRWRAAQITTMPFRHGLADRVLRVLEAAEDPPPTPSSVAEPRRAQVLAARGALLSAVRELRRERAVRPRGVALIQGLLTDVRGPLYAATADEEVERAVRAARDAL